MFEYLVSSGWNCLKKIRRHGLVWCSVSPGQALGFQKTSAIQVTSLGWAIMPSPDPFSSVFSSSFFVVIRYLFQLYLLFVCLFSKSFSSNTYSEPWLSNSGLSESFFLICFQNHFFLVFYLIFSHNIYWSYSFPSLTPPHLPSHTTSYSHSLSETKWGKMKNKQNLVRHKYQNKNITKSPTK